MKFGGHETFSLREGWLHKGLKLLVDNPDRLVDQYAQDWLGVGRNMAKSIRHWLLATGVAKRRLRLGDGQRLALEVTALGRLIQRRDPYFLERGTWWALHVNLVNTPEHAKTWWWFFNHFVQARFERATCVEGLRRFLQLTERRVPSVTTLQRDLACLLATYSQTVPSEAQDPEEANDSPFTELGLLTHFRDSGFYRREEMSSDAVPPEILGYALTKFDKRFEASTEDYRETTIRDACFRASGPGRCFSLTLEELHRLAEEAETHLGSRKLEVVNLAGERVLRHRTGSPEVWLEEYYQALDSRGRDAA